MAPSGKQHVGRAASRDWTWLHGRGTAETADQTRAEKSGAWCRLARAPTGRNAAPEFETRSAKLQPIPRTAAPAIAHGALADDDHRTLGRRAGHIRPPLDPRPQGFGASSGSRYLALSSHGAFGRFLGGGFQKKHVQREKSSSTTGPGTAPWSLVFQPCRIAERNLSPGGLAEITFLQFRTRHRRKGKAAWIMPVQFLKTRRD